MESSLAADIDQPHIRKAHGAAGIRTATFALLIATVFWGCGFTWAKEGGADVNRLCGLPHGDPLGPIWLLSVRFISAGLLWLIIFPAARRRWSLGSIGRALLIGTILAAGLVAQHLGLDRSSEAVTAFLTSLTILFVPLFMTVALRRPPPGVLWIGVALATVGVWLMTGASARGFGLGEILAISCAIIFSAELIVLNIVVDRDDPARIAAGQFLAVGILTGITCLFLRQGPQALLSRRLITLIMTPGIGWNLLLMVTLVTIGSYGLQTHFQPRIDPTRAALLYLCEPIFASVYAWLIAGRGLGRIAILGAGLILLTNGMVEWIQARAARARGERPTGDAGAGPAVID